MSWSEEECPNPPDVIRFFFVTADGHHRQFCQFRRRGHDIYWGPPGKSQEVVANHEVEGNAIRLTVGDATGRRLSSQASYHQSGQYHLKVGGEMQGDPLTLSPPEQLDRPLRAGVMMTKAPVAFPIYGKDLGSGPAVNVQLDATSEQRRIHFEVFFSPTGTVEFPHPCTAILDPHDVGRLTSMTITSRLVIVGWFDPMSESFTQWQPDKSLWFAGPIRELSP